MTKGLFLDRDGVINKDYGYVHKIADFDYIDGIFELCGMFVKGGFKIFVVSNQSGIARGFFTEKEYRDVNDWMIDTFQKKRIPIDASLYCPSDDENHIDRKPNPGMLLKIRDRFHVDMPNSVLIGDRKSDIQAGISAGIGTCLCLRGRYEVEDKAFCFESHFQIMDYFQHIFIKGGVL